MQKPSYNREKIQELYLTEKNKTELAKKYCLEMGVEYSDVVRRRISKIVNKEFDGDLENNTVTASINYSNDKLKPQKGFTAIGADGKLMNIETYCRFYGLDVSKIRSYKLITHQNIPFYNAVFMTSEEEDLVDLSKHFEEIVQKYILPVDNTNIPGVGGEWFDRLVYTDVHIAMDVQGKTGDPLYDGKWDKEEVLNRLNKMITHVIEYKKSDTIVIDCLGDFLDGLGGETTRKGHELPQNMNDKEAFDLGLEFKNYLVEKLTYHYSTIICNNLTNDNHSGVFAYFVSNASKMILENKYPNGVTINTIKRFIDHYSIGNHTFVILHGKDLGEQKFGFKPKLDAIQAEKIDQYCKEHKLYDGKFIEVSKGDSHQAIYDDTTSNDFSYYNYPAFSPPSNWVKTNFKLSKSGFRFYNIHREKNLKIAIPYFF